MKYLVPAIAGASAGLICWMLYLFLMGITLPYRGNIIFSICASEAEKRTVAEGIIKSNAPTIHAAVIGAVFPVILALGACLLVRLNSGIFQKSRKLQNLLIFMGLLSIPLGLSFADFLLPRVSGRSVRSLHYESQSEYLSNSLPDYCKGDE